MSLSYNGTEPQSITYNGADVQTVTYNGVEVWSAGFRVDENTLALLHFDSGVLTDAAGKYTWVTRGTPTLNTSNKKFGAASLDTTGGGVVAQNSSAFSFSSGSAFTMEGWVYLPDYSKANHLFSKHNAGHNMTYEIGTDTDGTIIVMDSSATVKNRSTAKVPIQKWVHIAVARGTSGNAKIFLDGTKILETSINFSGSQPFAIGLEGDGFLWRYGNMLVDEVRISDVCRYTTNFTPR